MRARGREHREGRRLDEGGVVRVEVADFLEGGDFVDLAVERLERCEIADDVIGHCVLPKRQGRSQRRALSHTSIRPCRA